ncbi:MAG: hypothetical protein ACK4PR_04860 [Gammaproteobacteria bacterium]
MKPTITLLGNEKILFECAPHSSYTYVLMLRNLEASVVFIGVFLAFGYFQHNPVIYQLMNYFIINKKITFIVIGALIILDYLFATLITKYQYYIITNQRFIAFSQIKGSTKDIVALNLINDIVMRKGRFNLYTVRLSLNTKTYTGNKQKSSMNRFLSGLSFEDAEKVSNILNGQIVKKENPQITIGS